MKYISLIYYPCMTKFGRIAFYLILKGPLCFDSYKLLEYGFQNLVGYIRNSYLAPTVPVLRFVRCIIFLSNITSMQI